jgi:hypothetical protein
VIQYGCGVWPFMKPAAQMPLLIYISTERQGLLLAESGNERRVRSSTKSTGALARDVVQTGGRTRRLWPTTYCSTANLLRSSP